MGILILNDGGYIINFKSTLKCEKYLDMKNQFILDFINESGGKVKEYDLIKHIECEQPEFYNSLTYPLSLFKKHFYLFHQLYNLRNHLKDSGQSLDISSLEISLVALQTKSNNEIGEEIGETDALKAFYLDITNLQLSDQEVALMLSQFWEKYLALDKKSAAIRRLGLQDNKKLDLISIKSAYNKLAHSYHPDKGGDQAEFLEIQRAYEILKVWHI